MRTKSALFKPRPASTHKYLVWPYNHSVKVKRYIPHNTGVDPISSGAVRCNVTRYNRLRQTKLNHLAMVDTVIWLCVSLLTLATSAQATCTIDGTCSSGWVYYCNSCYLFQKEEVNQTTARETCETEGGYLTAIEDEPENQFIYNRTTAESWIGLTTNISGDNRGCNHNVTCNRLEWMWYDGSTVGYTFWVTEQMADSEPTGDSPCVRMKSRGWADFDCNANKHYVCEKTAINSIDITATTTTTFPSSTTYPPTDASTAPSTTMSTTKRVETSATSATPSPSASTTGTVMPTTTTTASTTGTAMPTTATTSSTTGTVMPTTATTSSTTGTVIQASTTTTSPNSMQTSSNADDLSGREKLIYVVVAGVVAAVLIPILAIIAIYIRHKRKSQSRTHKIDGDDGGHMNQRGHSDNNQLGGKAMAEVTPISQPSLIKGHGVVLDQQPVSTAPTNVTGSDLAADSRDVDEGNETTSAVDGTHNVTGEDIDEFDEFSDPSYAVVGTLSNNFDSDVTSPETVIDQEKHIYAKPIKRPSTSTSTWDMIENNLYGT